MLVKRLRGLQVILPQTSFKSHKLPGVYRHRICKQEGTVILTATHKQTEWALSLCKTGALNCKRGKMQQKQNKHLFNEHESYSLFFCFLFFYLFFHYFVVNKSKTANYCCLNESDRIHLPRILLSYIFYVPISMEFTCSLICILICIVE